MLTYLVTQIGSTYYDINQICRCYENMLDPTSRLNTTEKIEGYEKPMTKDEVPPSFHVGIIKGEGVSNDTYVVKLKIKTFDVKQVDSLFKCDDYFNMFSNQYFAVTDWYKNFTNTEHKMHKLMQAMKVSPLYPHYIRFVPGKDLNVIAKYCHGDKDVSTSAGKLLRQLPWPLKRKDADIEKLCNTLKSILFQDLKFDIVEGEDIRKWYHESRYYYKAGTLSNSCMRYSACQDYLDMYCKTDCKMVIATNPDGQLCGRAILWPRSMWNKDYFQHSDYIMDRIYGIESTIMQFKEYAEDNLFTYKKHQNYSDNQCFMTPSSRVKGCEYIDESKRMQMNWEQRGFNYWPYADTFNVLKIDEDGVKNFGSGDTLTETDGQSHDGCSRATCEDCGESVHEDNTYYVNDYPYCSECAVYSEYSDEYYRNDDTVYSEYENSYLYYEDAYEITHGPCSGDWVHQDDRNTVYRNEDSVVHSDHVVNNSCAVIKYLNEDNCVKFKIYIANNIDIEDSRVVNVGSEVSGIRINTQNTTLPDWCTNTLSNWNKDYLLPVRYETIDGQTNQFIELWASMSEDYNLRCWNTIMNHIKALDFVFNINKIRVTTEEDGVSENFSIALHGVTNNNEDSNNKFERFFETMMTICQNFNITNTIANNATN